MKFVISILLLVVLNPFSFELQGQSLSSKHFKLKAERILENELGLSLFIVGPYLLTKQDQFIPDKEIYHVYDLKSFEFLGGIGMRDKEAPYAFHGVVYGGQHYENNGEWVLWVNDPPRFRISAFNITKSLAEGQPVFDETIKHEPELDFMNTLFVLKDKTLVAHQPGFHFGTNKQPWNTFKNDVLESFGEYPVVKNFPEGKKWEDYRVGLNSTRLVLHPQELLLTSGMTYYDLLSIYSIDGDLLFEYKPKETFQLYKAKITKEQKISYGEVKMYYLDMVTTDSKIYALYLNDLPGDEKTKLPIIRVFDWKANLLYELEVPVSIWNIAVDEENGFIYAGSYDEEALYRFSTKGVID